ncbi:MAG TPA: HAMP domain-containing protein, partial [Cystobacter sp.]
MNPRIRSSARPQTGKKKVRKARPAARQARARPRRSASARALEDLLDSLRAVTAGDFSVRLTPEAQPRSMEELAHAFNALVAMNQRMQDELVRVERVVGREGQMAERASLGHVSGGWASSLGSINSLIADLVQPTTEVARVLDAVARGDLTQKMALDLPGQPVKGEFLRIGTTVNAMVEQLSSFAAEVTRVAREVGTEGKLGGQADVPGVSGVWKDLTDNVNLMATNLTNQVRGIADVVTAVAQGNLKRKLTVDAKGEIAALAETINFMIDTLSTFGDQVTNMAREVGIEGKLGGQARVPGAAGLWRDLTDNVNQLAANLTNQVRSIADVATAVTKGDLTRSIAVEASGEMAALKDTINEMIRNLKDQTLKNAEQDWLKTNLARFSRMLQGERDLTTVSNLIMSELAPLVNAQYGVFYVTKREEDETKLELVASYGAESHTALKREFKLREG